MARHGEWCIAELLTSRVTGVYRFWRLNKVTRVVDTWRCGIGQVWLLGSCPFYEKIGAVIIWILFSGSVRRDRFVCYPK